MPRRNDQGARSRRNGRLRRQIPSSRIGAVRGRAAAVSPADTRAESFRGHAGKHPAALSSAAPRRQRFLLTSTSISIALAAQSRCCNSRAREQRKSSTNHRYDSETLLAAQPQRTRPIPEAPPRGGQNWADHVPGWTRPRHLKTGCLTGERLRNPNASPLAPSLDPHRRPRAQCGSRRWGVVLDVPARPQRSLPVGCDYQHHTLMCNRNQRSADRFYPMTGGRTPPLPAATCADWLCRSWVVQKMRGRLLNGSGPEADALALRRRRVRRTWWS